MQLADFAKIYSRTQLRFFKKWGFILTLGSAYASMTIKDIFDPDYSIKFKSPFKLTDVNCFVLNKKFECDLEQYYFSKFEIRKSPLRFWRSEELDFLFKITNLGKKFLSLKYFYEITFVQKILIPNWFFLKELYVIPPDLCQAEKEIHIKKFELVQFILKDDSGACKEI